MLAVWHVFGNKLVERSPLVPRSNTEPPVPDWKLDEWFAGSLPANDPAHDPNRPSKPSIRSSDPGISHSLVDPAIITVDLFSHFADFFRVLPDG